MHKHQGVEICVKLMFKQTDRTQIGKDCRSIESFTQNLEVQLQSNCSSKGLQIRYAWERRVRRALVSRGVLTINPGNVFLALSVQTPHQIFPRPRALFSAQ